MKLLLFTHSFPFTENEVFLRSEIKYLCSEFESVKILPLTNGELKVSALEEEYSNLYLEEPIIAWPVASLVFLSSLLKMKGNSLIFSKDWLRSPLRTLKQFFIIKIMLFSDRVQKLIEKSDVLYFYWGTNSCSISPFIKDKIKVSRFHGYDLYDSGEFKQVYLPFRENTLKSLDFLFPISNKGKEFFLDKDIDESKIKVFRLGVMTNSSSSSRFSSEKCHIVSCSSIISLKRVDLIAKSLMYLEEEVYWTHFGGGVGFEELKEITSNLPKNIHVDLKGFVQNKYVLKFYKENDINFFINVSTTEGIPVSAMEALSCSIPLMMTDVGGSSELVSKESGVLIPRDISPIELSVEIRSFMITSNKLSFREGAFNMWNENYNSKVNFEQFSKFLSRL